MIRVSVLYPSSAGSTFDMDYYLQKHVPMVLDMLGTACKGSTVDQGLGSAETPAAYMAIGHMLFDSVEDFQSSFGPHSAEIMSDVPNYTNVQAVLQLSKVVL